MAEQRSARSRTPESPRPVHIPEPSSIPVLANQMDPVFNDTTTYNIPADVADNDGGVNSLTETEDNSSHELISSSLNPMTANPPPLPDAQALYPDLSTELPATTIPAIPTDLITHAAPDVSAPTAVQAPLERAAPHSEDTLHQAPDQGVDFQSLLDNISQSSTNVPTTDSTTLDVSETAPYDQSSALPNFSGLPKKPPTQDATGTHTHDQVSALPPAQSTDPSVNAMLLSSLPNMEAFTAGMTHDQAIALHMQEQQLQTPGVVAATPPPREATSSADRPWTPKTQAVYDDFLEDERRYVSEGIWDRFPIGSRLFVGNLPSEKVTKRDLFHKFHKHGRLAQISIKQAYGFVQYHEQQSCLAALNTEQNTEIRGRKVHLEISKPQKNTKGSRNSTGGGNNNNSRNRQRSRSPHRRNYSDFRDEPSRKRSDYRRRSPSPDPRRDEYRTGSRGDRYSQSYGGAVAPDDESNLPYPRRQPDNVPDVQLIVKDNVHHTFVNWVEDNLRRKQVSSNTIWLDARTPLAAVIKRQIVEGVQAVVEIDAQAQSRSKIPLKVFNRVPGSTNVTWSEYADLDPPVAADVVISARATQRNNTDYLRQQYPPGPPSQNYAWSSQQYSATPQQLPPPPIPQYGFPQQPQQIQHQQFAGFPPPPPVQSYRPPQPTPTQATPNLQQLLANLKGGPAAGPTPPQPPYQPPQQGQQMQYTQGNLQNIMADLAKYNNR